MNEMLKDKIDELRRNVDAFSTSVVAEIERWSKQDRDLSAAECVRVNSLLLEIQGRRPGMAKKQKKAPRAPKQDKASPEAPSRAARGEGYEYEFDCEFGGVSGQKKGAKIGIQIHSDCIDLPIARELFRSSALKVEIRANIKDAEGQQTTAGESVSAPKLATVAVAKGWSDGVDHISTSLTIPGVDVNLGELGQFRYRKGKLKLTRTGDAKPDGDEDVPGQERIEEPDEDGPPDIEGE